MYLCLFLEISHLSFSFFCGLILDNVTRGRHEMKCLAYLAIPLHKRDDPKD